MEKVVMMHDFLNSATPKPTTHFSPIQWVTYLLVSLN